MSIEHAFGDWGAGKIIDQVLSAEVADDFATETRSDEISLIPRGWKTAEQMAIVFGHSIQEIEAMIATLQKCGTKLKTEEYVGSNGKFQLYFGPGAAMFINIAIRKNKKELAAREAAPESKRVVVEQVAEPEIAPVEVVENSKPPTITRSVDGPEQKSDLESTSGDPDRVPEGWMTTKGIAKRLGVHYNTLAKRLNELSDLEKGEFKNAQHKKLIYYSPAAIAIIDAAMKDFIETPLVPKDWMSFKGLAKYLNIHRDTLLPKMQNLTGLETKEYKTASGAMHVYYSPEAVARIQAVVEGTDLAPKDWLTITDIRRKLVKKNLNASRNLSKKVGQAAKDLIGEGILIEKRDYNSYKNHRGQTLVFYSPTAIEKIRARAEK